MTRVFSARLTGRQRTGENRLILARRPVGRNHRCSGRSRRVACWEASSDRSAREGGRGMDENGARVSRVLAIDAGGTMTDTFIVDEHGSFVVGKAQTTPEDESVGFVASARDALGQWGTTPEEGFPSIVSGIYSGTA